MTCPLCLDHLGRAQSHSKCGACRTPYHRACFNELGGCGTLGCAEKGLVAVVLEPEIRVAPRPSRSHEIDEPVWAPLARLYEELPVFWLSLPLLWTLMAAAGGLSEATGLLLCAVATRLSFDFVKDLAN